MDCFLQREGNCLAKVMNSELVDLVNLYRHHCSAFQSKLDEMKDILNESESHQVIQNDIINQLKKENEDLKKVNQNIRKEYEFQQQENARILENIEILQTTSENERLSFFSKIAETKSQLSQLQVNLVETQHHVLREKDQNKIHEETINDFKNQIFEMKITASKKGAKNTEINVPTDKLPYYGRWTALRAETKKLHKVEEYRRIMNILHKDAGLSSGQEMEIICLLWHRLDKASTEIQEIECFFSEELKKRRVPLKDYIKILAKENKESNLHITRLENEFDALKQNKARCQEMLQQEISKILQDYQITQSKLQLLEDQFTLQKKENQSLKIQMKQHDNNRIPDEITSMQKDLDRCSNETHHLKLQNQVLKIELDALKHQLEGHKQTLRQEAEIIFNQNKELMKLQEINASMNEAIQKITIENEKLESKTFHQLELNEKMSNEVGEIKINSDSLRNELNMKKREIGLLHVKLLDYQEQQNLVISEKDNLGKQLETLISSFHGQLTRAKNDLDDALEQIEVKNRRIQEKENNYTLLSKEADELWKDKDKLSKELKQLNGEFVGNRTHLLNQNQSLNTQLELKIQEIHHLLAKLRSTEDTLRQLEIQLEYLETKDQEFKLNLMRHEHCELTIKSLKQENRQLREEFYQLRSVMSLKKKEYLNLEDNFIQLQTDLNFSNSKAHHLEDLLDIGML